MSEPNNDGSAATDAPSNLRGIFIEALNQPSPQERERYIAETCGDDAKLLEQVRSLLEAYGKSGDYLEQTVMGDVGEPVSEGPGTVIGRYKLLEKIGQGGFGVVYVAEQQKPLQRRVALKIIKLGMDTRQVVARFEAERQALARMDHPNIAKVFDAGATDTGRPYFVMELVRGTKITEYCDQHRLNPEQRLRLFVQVCHAIQHAHQKGIIHRDLKPSNVLVMMHDDVPLPKVIDFGIAKATEGRLTDKTLYTAWEQMIGTPAYMSPEQAKQSGLDVDTRSDIYSLGVLLYELLTGRTPFDSKELTDAGLDEMRRLIREVEPKRPSTRLSTLGKAEANTVAGARGTEALRLVGLLRGDLDWIVMKSLEKDRTRRYETANGLARDVERYLGHEAVLARPPSTAYVLRKWARRNKVAFATGGAITVALLIALAASIFAAFRERAHSLELKENLARQYLRSGRNLAKTGDLVEGLHWMARSLEELPAGNPLPKESMEQNLTAWTRRWVAPAAVVDHQSAVLSAAFSPDGESLAVGAEDGSLTLWSADLGKFIWRSNLLQGSVFTVAFSPDGQKILAVGDQHARVLSFAQGVPITPPLEHRSQMSPVGAFSPDGRGVLTASWDGTAQVWSSDTGERLTRSLRHGEGLTNGVNNGLFSHDGKLVLTGSWDGTAQLWDAKTGQPVGSPFDHGANVNHTVCVDLSPDGRTVATAGVDGLVRLWSVASGKEKCPPLRTGDFLRGVRFSPDGATILTASLDRTARLWSADTGQPHGPIMPHEGKVVAAVFSPDGRMVLTGASDGTARLWSSQSSKPLGQPLRIEDGFRHAVVFSPNGEKFVTLSSTMIRLWSAEAVTGLPFVELDTRYASTVAFRPDGRSVVTGNEEGEVQIWSTETAELSASALQADAGVKCVAFSSDGESLAAGGADKVVRLWREQSDGSDITLVHSNVVTDLIFDPDDEWIVTASKDKQVRIWSAGEGKLLRELPSHPELVSGLAFASKGQILLTACEDGFVRFWSITNWQENPPAIRHGLRLNSIAVDGPRGLLASGGGDGKVRFWDVATRRPTGLMLEQGSPVTKVCYSRDGKLLAAASHKEVRLWSTETGEQIGPDLEDEWGVFDMDFSPDGRRLLTGSLATSGAAKMWMLAPSTDSRVADPTLWIEAITGMRMDDQGILTVLPE